MDGEVDYSQYSVEQLREAEAGINRANYPLNFARLKDELVLRGIAAKRRITEVAAPKAAEPIPKTVMKRLAGWIESTSYQRLVVGYIFAVPSLLVLGWLAFYFPVYPIYSLLGWEFSNLGPIVTILWGYLIAKFVLTPTFVLVLLFKSFLQSSSKA